MIKLNNLKIVFIFIIFSFKCYSHNLVVVNVQSLIDNNSNYLKVLKKIEISQKKHLEKFNTKELELQNLLKEIEDSKLILDEIEIKNKIDSYNINLDKFTLEVDKFNLHYQNEIIKIRETIFEEIIVLLQKYAIENNIDLILDSSSYLIASNSINIDDYIEKEINNLDLNLSFETFK